MIRHEGLASCIALAVCLAGCGSDEVTFGSGQGGATSSSGSAQGGAASSSSAAQGGATATTTTTTTGQGGQGTQCGNGVIEGDEACDGDDLGGNDCTAFGFSNPGGLACTDGCALDASGCKAVCGNGAVEPDEDCDDMNTVGGDGCDDNCQLEEGTTCATAQAINLALTQSVTLTGDTTAGGSHASSQCQDTSASPDRVYLVTPGADGFLTVWLDRPSTAYDSVLYALGDCLNPSSGIWCADAFDPASNNDNGGEVLSFEVVQGQSVYVVVDGWNGSSGAYQVTFDLSAGTCADPIPFPIWSGAPMNALGSNTNKPNNSSTSTCGGGSAGEVVYEVTPEFSGALEARLPDSATNFDAVLSARLACNGSELSCSHNGSGDEVVSLMVVDTLSYFVLVDGFTGSEGDYRLRLAP